jgi:hypothetical protein
MKFRRHRIPVVFISGVFEMLYGFAKKNYGGMRVHIEANTCSLLFSKIVVKKRTRPPPPTHLPLSTRSRKKK